MGFVAWFFLRGGGAAMSRGKNGNPGFHLFRPKFPTGEAQREQVADEEKLFTRTGCHQGVTLYFLPLFSGDAARGEHAQNFQETGELNASKLPTQSRVKRVKRN